MRRAVVVGVMGLLILTLVTCSSGEGGKINGNLDAERLVEVGMVLQEVGDLIASPRPPWTSLNLREATSGDSWGIPVTLPDGSTLQLTSDDGPALPPYFAYIFFPQITASSRPTWIWFQFLSEPPSVIAVSRVTCEETILVLAVGGQHTGVPPGSACKL